MLEPARARNLGHSRSAHCRGETARTRDSGLPPLWHHPYQLRETEYQFRDDFVMDSSAAQARFGLKPAPWEEIVAVTVGSASR